MYTDCADSPIWGDGSMERWAAVAVPVTLPHRPPARASLRCDNMAPRAWLSAVDP